MHLEETKGEEILLRLTYVNLDTEVDKSFDRLYSYGELKTFVEETITEYLKFVRLDAAWKKERDHSLRDLPFPFLNYRLGQRDLAVDTYRAIRQGGKLFAKAPTGIGKTISTLFPAVKAVGEGEADKIFYLTSKGTLKTVAEEAVDIIHSTQMKARLHADLQAHGAARPFDGTLAPWSYEPLDETDRAARAVLEAMRTR